ncbi:hypothetical protein ES1_09910 [[Eubacterium] siraeum V10Sc8a]|uniref:Uncharacterized protein n=1 Tax=[Eubacterium] siraeum V10Sc8a TaxID=717961 RepID=D4MJW0_9FIRM|nr:hypothetical protein ES1_09910 [[Eubacterium] siraeum V10Sc8a]
MSGKKLKKPLCLICTSASAAGNGIRTEK